MLDDGTVKITELATAAALDGIEVGDDADSAMDGEQATALDTRDLIALAYATLTATWPLPTPSDLPARAAGRRPPGAAVADRHRCAGRPRHPLRADLRRCGGARHPRRPRRSDRAVGAPAARGAGRGRVPAPARPHAALTAADATPPTPARPPERRSVPSRRRSRHRHAPPAPPRSCSRRHRYHATRRPSAATPARCTVRREPAPRAADRPLGGLDVLYDDLDHEDEHQPLPTTRRRAARRAPCCVLVAVFVALFLVLAYCGLRGPGGERLRAGTSSTRSPSTRRRRTPSATSAPRRRRPRTPGVRADPGRLGVRLRPAGRRRGEERPGRQGHRRQALDAVDLRHLQDRRSSAD